MQVALADRITPTSHSFIIARHIIVWGRSQAAANTQKKQVNQTTLYKNTVPLVVCLEYDLKHYIILINIIIKYSCKQQLRGETLRRLLELNKHGRKDQL